MKSCNHGYVVSVILTKFRINANIQLWQSFFILNFEIGIVSDFLQYINTCSYSSQIFVLDPMNFSWICMFFRNFVNPLWMIKGYYVFQRGKKPIFFIVLGLNVADDLPLYQPQQRRVAAPKYYPQDGKTPIYKVFKRNPYGRRQSPFKFCIKNFVMLVVNKRKLYKSKGP